MKTTTFLPLLLVFLTTSLFSQTNIQQSLSVNSTGAVADPSALLDVSATDKGMLVPRMTTAQRTAIASPATGLLVFDTTTGGFWFYNGTTWANLSAPKTLQDADGNTKVQVEENPNEDIIRFDLGGTESMVLRKNAGNSARLELPNNFVNTFVGTNAGQVNTAGSFNTAYGGITLSANTSGSYNTANGAYALANNSTGDSNTANGYTALGFNGSGNDNTANGASALNSNTTGNGNTANGMEALRFNTTGFSNTGIGVHSLYNNTVRSNLVAVGDSALYNNGTGATLGIHATGNTALGSKALFANTTGYSNTAVGRQAMLSNSTGFQNTSGGDFALGANTTGTENTGLGYGALNDNITGIRNTALGFNALNTNTTGSQNTAIGFNAFFTVNNLSNTTCIGYSSGGISNASNRIEIGNTSVSAIAGQVNFSVYSDARIKTQVQENVPGLDFITKLRPVTYHLDIHKQNDLCFKGKKDIGEWEGKYDIELKQMTGFIAQEVEAAAKASGYDFSGVEKGADEVGLYSVKYAEFVVPLVKGMQEQQKIIENGKLRMENLEDMSRELGAENAALKAELHTSKAQLSAQAAQLDKITAALQGAGIAVEK